VLLIGFIVPGVTILLLAGFLVSTGEIDPVRTVLWGTLGTLLGDTINFSFGRYGLARLPWGQRLLTRHSRVVSFVREASPRLFVLYHFPGYLRTFFPMVLGSMRYPVAKWIWIELCGAPLFNVTFVMAGWVAGRATREIVSAMDMGALMVRGVLLLSAGWLVILAIRLRRVWKRGREAAGDGEE
jgi:membrane protein DedA with SNARE-associated domain